MIGGHTYYGGNGNQNTMFPLEYMYLSQGEGGSYSHLGTLAMDFVGYDANGRVYRCPYYAPCNLQLVATPDNSNHIYVYTSTVTVNFVDGTSGIFTMMVNHDNDIYTIGRTVLQGQQLGKTGTYGNGSSTGVGDHVHIEVKKGAWEGLIQNSQGVWCMKNADHLYNLFGVNDTVLIETGSYNWQEYPITPTPSGRSGKFPWFIYANKLRNKRNGVI